jgi:hypothetical protein
MVKLAELVDSLNIKNKNDFLEYIRNRNHKDIDLVKVFDSNRALIMFLNDILVKYSAEYTSYTECFLGSILKNGKKYSIPQGETLVCVTLCNRDVTYVYCLYCAG